MFDVFCRQLYEMNPQNCRRKRLGDGSYGTLTPGTRYE